MSVISKAAANAADAQERLLKAGSLLRRCITKSKESFALAQGDQMC